MRHKDIACGVYPKAIIRKYKENDRRDKARAFLEWWTDQEADTNKSNRFYASEWNVSKTTVHTWIKEFEQHQEELKNLCE